MKHGSLFSGIGGFDLAAEWMGWENVFHCERNEFGQRILKFYWPKAINYDDITKTDFTIHQGRIDILTGGFPCQDISIAGPKTGLSGNRSSLFYHYIRAVNESKPRIAIWENVSQVQQYLPAIVEAFSEIGYCLQWTTVRASWFGLPHQRERVFGIAYNTDCFRWKEIQVQAGIIEKEIFKTSKRQFSRATCRQIQLENYSKFLRMDDGLPHKLLEESIKAYGNAIVPQVAYQIFKAIENTQKQSAQGAHQSKTK